MESNTYWSEAGLAFRGAMQNRLHLRIDSIACGNPSNLPRKTDSVRDAASPRIGQDMQPNVAPSLADIQSSRASFLPFKIDPDARRVPGCRAGPRAACTGSQGA